MSRRSKERRANERAAVNERQQKVRQRVLERWAPSAPRDPLQRVEYLTAHEILERDGLTAGGVRNVGSNCAGFTNSVLEPKARKPTAACAPGCAWCCVLEVSAWPVEIIQLAAHIEARQTPAERSSLLAKLREAVTLADRERSAGRRPRITCPLLTPQRTCSVHEARPSSCAATFSLDAAPCQAYAEGTEHEHKDRIGVVVTLLVPARVAAHVVMQHGGPATDGGGAGVDLHTGLAAALEAGAEATAAAWLAGKDVFRDARERSRSRAATLDAEERRPGFPPLVTLARPPTPT